LLKYEKLGQHLFLFGERSRWRWWSRGRWSEDSDKRRSRSRMRTSTRTRRRRNKWRRRRRRSSYKRSRWLRNNGFRFDWRGDWIRAGNHQAMSESCSFFHAYVAQLQLID
jgi:hypothetical protein